LRSFTILPCFYDEVSISTPAGDDSTSGNTTNKSAALDILLIGVPLNEPVARYGPFVMNTEEEILQTIEDYRNGRMGEIAVN
jgi:redox-sensitive bicupin YhaK (pirin superfamily)